jgi:hypothetical protein
MFSGFPGIFWPMADALPFGCALPSLLSPASCVGHTLCGCGLPYFCHKATLTSLCILACSPQIPLIGPFVERSTVFKSLFFRNANSQTLPQIYWMRTYGVDVCVRNAPGDSDECSSLTTVLKNGAQLPTLSLNPAITWHNGRSQHLLLPTITPYSHFQNLCPAGERSTNDIFPLPSFIFQLRPHLLQTTFLALPALLSPTACTT